jgi:eukaryotic-like serine/threonine-protein kinase
MADASPTPPSADQKTARMVGALLSDRYRVTSLLGEGGMGEVYLGEHLLMRKRVAIKVLHPDMMSHDEVVARFEREAMAAAHIDHPNVAAATDFGRTPDGAFFLVLEYIEGRSLRAMLAGLSTLPAGRALHIARQVSGALARAHELGIVHRDLKPENVMLVARGQDTDFVKVLDFGIAKVPVQELTGKATVVDPLTRMGVMYGTPEYMAPEQALGQEVDARADLYALGVMLYEMVTGGRPFDAADPVSLVAQHITTPPQPPSLRNPAAGVPQPVEDLVLRLLSKDPKARPASAAQVVETIDEIMGGPARGMAPSSIAYPPASVSYGRPSSPGWSPSPGPVASLPTEAPVSGVAATSVATGIAAPASTGVEVAVAYLPTYVASTQLGAEAIVPAPPAQPSVAPATPQSPAPSLRERLQPLLSRARTVLEDVRGHLPPPLKRVPLPALVGAAALPPIAFLALIIALVGGGGEAAGDAGGGSVDGGSTPGATVEAPVPTPSATPAELGAAASSVEGLTALAEKYPRDVNVRASIVKAYSAQKRHREAVEAARELAELEPTPSLDEGVLQALRAAALSPQAEAGAIALLESLPGPQGPNVLYDLSTARDSTPKAKAAAQRSLAKAEVAAKASPALAVFLAFKQAQGCEAKHALLPRAVESGDARMLPLLKPLLSRNGCGGGLRRFLGGGGDCYACLRDDTLLTDALKAVEGRPFER